MVAALGGYVSVVKKLLAKGADLDNPGWNALTYAATGGQNDVVRVLLDAGANVNASGPNGTTALMMAVRGGHAATVDLLLEKGADPGRRNENGARIVVFVGFPQRHAQAPHPHRLRSGRRRSLRSRRE